MNGETINPPKHRYYQLMFVSAAFYNWSATLIWLLSFEQMYAFMGGGDVPQAPIFNLFMQLVALLLSLFGGIYFCIGRDPDSAIGRPFAIIGIIAKVIFVCLFTCYAISGSVPWAMAALVFVDLLWAALFLEYIFYQSAAAETSANQ